MILIVGPSPAAQRRLVFPSLKLDAVNRAVKVERLASGKPINAVRAAVRLGKPARALVFLGGDTGAWMRRELEAEGLPLRVIPTAAATRLCDTVIESESNRVTELVENAGAVSETEVAAFRRAFAEELASARLMVLIGTLPPGLPPTIYREMTAAAVARGLPVIVDAQGDALRHALEARPLLVKPNRHELGAALGMDCRDEDGLCRALSELHRRGATWAAISDGPGPVSLSNGSQWATFPPPKITPRNPIGSGDAMTAGMAAALLDGAEMPEALRHGIACGAASAAGEGYGRLDPQRVERLRSEVRMGPWQPLPTA